MGDRGGVKGRRAEDVTSAQSWIYTAMMVVSMMARIRMVETTASGLLKMARTAACGR